MNKQVAEANEPRSAARMAATAAYSAHIQEAMRYDKLLPVDYALAMSIMRAVSLGFTEKQWETEQQNTVRALQDRSTDKQGAHADAADRYEQTITLLKDLILWPW